MNSQRCWIVLTACLLLSCSASDNAATPNTQQSDRAAGTGSPIAEDEQLQGQAGVDYDPYIIKVGYPRNLPPLADTRQPAPGLRAADQPNAVLRHNREYEELTDAIAATLDLPIRRQVYYGDCNFASFNVPTDRDPETVLSQLREQFAGLIEQAQFEYLAHAALDTWMPDDPKFVSSSPTSGGQWGQWKIGCPPAWYYSRGDHSVRVAVVDTGVMLTHEELAAQVLDPQVHFPDCVLDLEDNDNVMQDEDGHGTFIAGIVAAEGNNGLGICGVAPNCEVIPIRIADDTNYAACGDMAAGCLLGLELGARAINLSWLTYHNDYHLTLMTQEVYEGGALLCCAAGNDENWDDPTYPASYTNAFGIGAADCSDRREEYSNFGDYVDIAAPGGGPGGGALLSCGISDNSDYIQWWGTSFATPMVASAAALLWSVEPALTLSDVRELLTITGEPTTGFIGYVPRLNLYAAMEIAKDVSIQSPAPEQLIHSGVVELTPQLIGTADRVELHADGELVAYATHAPWTLPFDSRNIIFDNVYLEFTAYKGSESSSDDLWLVIDNTAATFPVLEDFEDNELNFVNLDAKRYGFWLLQRLKYSGIGSWTPEEVATNGPAKWIITGLGAYEGMRCAGCFQPGELYGNYETDVLISRRITLDSIEQPSLVFQHRYNIEDNGQNDRAWVYAVINNGQLITPAKFANGASAYFTGYQPDWSLAEIDLSDFTGMQINLALVFESDEEIAGEDPEEETGWWVDNLVVAADYFCGPFPTLGTFTVQPSAVIGAVNHVSTLELTAVSPQDATDIRFVLDLEPIGVIDQNDVTTTVPAITVTKTQLVLPANAPNQIAAVRAQPLSSDGQVGLELTESITVFNLLGDATADNTVNQLDLDYVLSLLGTTSEDAAYDIFADADLNGVITESDAAAIGYYWGDSL